MSDSTLQDKLRKLPQVGHLLETPELRTLVSEYHHTFVKKICDEILEDIRRKIITEVTDIPEKSAIVRRIQERITDFLKPRIKSVINATGILLHTGLGRAPLLDEAYCNAFERVKAACNLELDLPSGKRGDRQDNLKDLLTTVCGSEDSAVANNNAAAVLLALNTLAYRKETLVSRGQLIEIGGSFRLPDVMKKSGTKLVEVGTTNKTYVHDYLHAITPQTRAVLAAHTSNYRIQGFVHEPKLKDIAEICRAEKLFLIHDLGGGVVIDLQRWTLPPEPVVRDSLEAGADVVTFSGDKILGGPQAGIIVGKKEAVRRIRKNPLMRALRPDKFTLALLEETLKLYLSPSKLKNRHPVLARLLETQEEVSARAEAIKSKILQRKLPATVKINVVQTRAQLGSGALPLETFPSAAVRFKVQNLPASQLARALRTSEPPIIGYTSREWVFLDVKAISAEEMAIVPRSIVKVLSQFT